MSNHDPSSNPSNAGDPGPSTLTSRAISPNSTSYTPSLPSSSPTPIPPHLQSSTSNMEKSSTRSSSPRRSALHTSSYDTSDPHHSSRARFADPIIPPPNDETTQERRESTISTKYSHHHHDQDEKDDLVLPTSLVASSTSATIPIPLPSSSSSAKTKIDTDADADADSTHTHQTHPSPLVLDIEHVPVQNDPRLWSNTKKTLVLYLVAAATLTPMLATSIYNPAFDQLRKGLGATDTELALSVSLFILFQGGWPIFWSSIAEVRGRKLLYILSFTFFITGSLVCSRAESMNVLIGMRLVQAFGSSAVLSLGAGTLSDMYEPRERGTKMGIYYGVPLIGPSLGPIAGGFLASAFDWRSTFYLIAALAGVTLVFFFFLPDSWRKERSTLYQAATKRALKRALAHHEKEEKSRAKKAARGLMSGATTPGTMTTRGQSVMPSGMQTPHGGDGDHLSSDEKLGINDGISPDPSPSSAEETKEYDLNAIHVDMGNKQVSIRKIGQVESQTTEQGRKSFWLFKKAKGKQDEEHEEVILTFADVNPFPAMWAILEVPSNLVILVSSGLLFACQYTIPFTAAVTFAEPPYSYEPWRIGLILLAFGGGNVLGSLLGGRYSDYMLGRLKKANGGVGDAEMRLSSTTGAMFFMVPSFLTYAWVCQEKTNIAGPVVALFGAGFFLMIIYASALAYIVDANPGRSSSAVACNSFFRGAFACVCSQVALPIRSAIGDGGLYTLLSGVLVISCLGFLLVIKKGRAWRSSGYRIFRRARKDSADVQGDANKAHP